MAAARLVLVSRRMPARGIRINSERARPARGWRARSRAIKAMAPPRKLAGSSRPSTEFASSPLAPCRRGRKRQGPGARRRSQATRHLFGRADACDRAAAGAVVRISIIGRRRAAGRISLRVTISSGCRGRRTRRSLSAHIDSHQIGSSSRRASSSAAMAPRSAYNSRRQARRRRWPAVQTPPFDCTIRRWGANASARIQRPVIRS